MGWLRVDGVDGVVGVNEVDGVHGVVRVVWAVRVQIRKCHLMKKEEGMTK